LNRNVRDEFAYLAPVVASLAVCVVLAFVYASAPVDLANVTVFPEGVGSFGNAVYFVLLVGVGAAILYVLLKRKSFRLIRVMTGFALGAAVFMLSLVFGWAGLARFNLPYFDWVLLMIAISATVGALYAIFCSKGLLATGTVLVLGGALGAFLGTAVPTLSAVLVLGFLAVYDVFAVYRGPVGKIARSGLDQLKGLSVSFREIQMGLGDLTFYSMLCGHMLLFFGPVPCLASVAGVLVGCVLSFRMLEKKGIFPGLPFPIAFGLAAGFAVAVLL
jgi:presenilin-like A22 family membrane protease